MAELTLESCNTNINPFMFNGVIRKHNLMSIENNDSNINETHTNNNTRNVNFTDVKRNVNKIINKNKTKEYGSMPKQSLVSAIIAIDGKVFPDLSRLAKSVLSQLSLLLDVEDPTKPIRMLRETLAELTGFKVASVYRALAELEKFDLIKRVEQNRKRSGRMGAGILKLTKKAIKALLPNWSESHASKGVESKPRLSKNIDGKALPESQSFSKNQSASVDETEDKVKFVEVENGKRMHPELLFLKEKLTNPQIFKLCRLAKEHKHHLTDIVYVKRDSIDKIWAGRELYSYLAFLAGTSDNFRGVAKDLRESSKAAAKEKNNESLMSSWFDKLIGKKYRSLKSGAIYAIELACTGYLWSYKYKDDQYLSSAVVDAGFIEFIKSGTLVPVSN
jgi:predicted transcriptional regulator